MSSTVYIVSTKFHVEYMDMVDIYGLHQISEKRFFGFGIYMNMMTVQNLWIDMVLREVRNL